MGLSLPVWSQESTSSVLKTRIDYIAQQIKSLQTEQDGLLRKNRALTDEINARKRQLQKGGNPLIELQLQNDLKASRALADQIQGLDQNMHTLTRQSVSLKKQLVDLLSTEIDKLSREATMASNAKRKKRQLERVLALQDEKDAYRAQISAESNELLLRLDITLVETDGPDEILQKLAIVRDQHDIIRAKIQQLNGQIQETQKKLNLRQNMLELLRDIRRGEDDEFDLDRNLRIAELQEDIATIEAMLEIIQAKTENLRVKEKALEEKAKQFSQEAEKFTQPAPTAPKGESLDRK